MWTCGAVWIRGHVLPPLAFQKFGRGQRRGIESRPRYDGPRALWEGWQMYSQDGREARDDPQDIKHRMARAPVCWLADLKRLLPEIIIHVAAADGQTALIEELTVAATLFLSLVH
jgi:hypothetical protein